MSTRDTYELRDPQALKALAHPLRGKLLASLRVDGPATASMLGRRYDESSAAASYHLRVLERWGFVEDDPEQRSGGRERWWRAAHTTTSWAPDTFRGFMRLTPPQLAALGTELDELIERYAALAPDGDEVETVAVIAHAFPQRGPMP